MVGSVGSAGAGILLSKDAPPAPAGDSGSQQQELVRTAAQGGPLDAGNALRTLDQQNGGNRAATSAQVRTAAETNTTTTVEKGVRTVTAGTARTQTSVDGVERQKSESKVVTRTDPTSWTRTESRSDATTAKLFDEKGRPAIDPATGQQAETVQSKSERKTEIKADTKGASYTFTGSEQRGSLSGSISNQTKVDTFGVGNQTMFTGTAGDFKATAGGGFQVGENGVGLNGKVGLGPLSAEHRTEVKRDEGSSKVTSTTTVRAGDGMPVKGSAELKWTHADGRMVNEDGSTTYRVTGEMKFTLAGGVDVKGVKADVSSGTGERTLHTVTVPKGVDVKSIDPNNPSAWPEGTRVMIKSEDYRHSTLGFGYQILGAEAKQEAREGKAIVMEKRAGDTVAVLAGPTSGFTSSGKLKVDLAAGFSVELGGENKTDDFAYQSFNVDLTAPGGASVIRDALTGQRVPSANGNGVSDLRSIATSDWSYDGSARLNTPFGDVGPKHQESSHSVWTTYEGGRTEEIRTYDADGDGTSELTVAARSADGKTFDKPEFTLSLPIANDRELAVIAQYVRDPSLKTGDVIEVTLTADELQGLRQKSWGSESIIDESPATQMNFVEEFAAQLGRIESSQAAVVELAKLNNSPDRNGVAPRVDPNHLLPGVVTIRR